MTPPMHHQASLSVHWAFVVQFQTDTIVEQGSLAGRVEHVVSGQATTFQSLETLLAFIAGGCCGRSGHAPLTRGRERSQRPPAFGSVARRGCK